MKNKLSVTIWLVVGMALLACGTSQVERAGQTTEVALAPPASPTAEPATAPLAPSLSAQPPLGTPIKTSTPRPSPTAQPPSAQPPVGTETKTPTRRPTATPSPQPTATPYTPPQGWWDYGVSDFNIALPEEWEVVDVDKEGIEIIKANLKAVDAEWARTSSEALEVASLRDALKFWAQDPEPAGWGYASMNVSSLRPSTFPLQARDMTTSMVMAAKQMGAEVVGVESSMVINGLDAARVTIRLPVGKHVFKEYVYNYVQERKMWAVAFSVDEEKWSDYEPIFRTAAQSFRVGLAKAPTATPRPTAANSLKVGLLAPLSGGLGFLGEETQNGVELAMAEWNARGGVLGRPIELVAEDSQCAPEPAVAAAKKVIDQDGVKFIIGDVCSSTSIDISEIANARQVVQIATTATQPGVTVDAAGQVKPYTFRACFADSYQGTAAARFALETLRAKTAFIMVDEHEDYVRGQAETFEKAFVEGGGRVVGKEPFREADTDFSAIVSKVADARPDVLYLPGLYSTINRVTAQVKQRGLDVVMLGGDGWSATGVDREAAEGGYFTNHYSADEPRAALQAWIQKYAAEYDTEPLPAAALGYDAAAMLFTAIQNAGSADPVQVKDALAALKDFEGVTGKVSMMDAQHNPIKSVLIFRVTKEKVEYSTTVAP